MRKYKGGMVKEVGQSHAIRNAVSFNDSHCERSEAVPKSTKRSPFFKLAAVRTSRDCFAALAMTKSLIILTFALLISNQAFSQDLEHLFDRFKKKPFKFTGDIAANQVFYASNGIDNRRSPYTYYLSGNLNVAFYGWNLPFNFSVSDQQTEYQTPPLQTFNRFGIAPYYKWVKLYAGYSNMVFSPYTFNGYTFLGGGAELTPGIFNFSAFYGRLHEAFEEDTANNIDPIYKRMAYGFKTGIKKDDLFVDLMFFKASDDSSSLQNAITNTEITPGENLVVGIKAGKTFMKTIKLEAEYASSAYTRDIRSAEQGGAPAFYSNLKGLFTPKASSQYYDAFKTALNYTGNGYGIGAGYERIDPGYQTMGAYYFNNDLENITMNANIAIFKQKMQIAFNVGVERNNLDKEKISIMKKTVAAVNVNYSPSAKWNLAASYSNFSSFTNIRSNFDIINQVDPLQPIDTLNFTQLTQSANANISYVIGDAGNNEKKQFLNLNLTSQLAANEQQGNPNAGSAFYNASMSYTLSLVPRDMSITAAFTTNYTEMPNAYNAMLGPMASVNRLFFEKTLRTSASLAWNQAYQNSSLSNTIINFRINTTYTYKKMHNFNLSLVTLYKTNKVPISSKLTEFTVTLGYSFSFATKDDRKKKSGGDEKVENGN